MCYYRLIVSPLAKLLENALPEPVDFAEDDGFAAAVAAEDVSLVVAAVAGSAFVEEAFADSLLTLGCMAFPADHNRKVVAKT